MAENIKLFMRTDDFFKSVNYCFRVLKQKERNISFKESSFREFLALSSKSRFLLSKLEQNLKDFLWEDELHKAKEGDGEQPSEKMQKRNKL